HHQPLFPTRRSSDLHRRSHWAADRPVLLPKPLSYPDHRRSSEVRSGDCCLQSTPASRAHPGKLGWTEDSNLRIELRWSADDPDRSEEHTSELHSLPN